MTLFGKRSISHVSRFQGMQINFDQGMFSGFGLALVGVLGGQGVSSWVLLVEKTLFRPL